MTQVVFDPTQFKASYPEFTTVSNAVLQNNFDQATLYLSNSDNSPVQNITRRTIYLNMLTAHITALSSALKSDSKPSPVGRVSNASEGSVSAAFDYMPATPGSGAWFNQTQYGAAFWQATSSLRGFRYVTVQRCVN